MTSALFDINPLLPLLADGGTVITPNNRLRNQLRLAYSEASNAHIVRSPAIYSLTEWLDLQWEKLVGFGYKSCNCLILNQLQQQAIWTDVVESSNFAAPSANYRSLVSHLIEAYRHLQLWEIPLEEVKSFRFDFTTTAPPDSSDLLPLWIEEFDQKRLSISAITLEHAQTIICDAFEKGHLLRHETLYLQSFDDLPPLTQRLFENSAQRIQDSLKNTSQGKKNQRQLIGLSELYQEASCAAQWSHQILQSTPDAKIGIIVPSLGNDRQLIERAFTEIFEPQFLNPAVERYPLPFNISAGTPLANTPLINDTLLLLKLNNNELTLNEWQTLLASPFFSNEEIEREDRANILLSIRKRQQFSISTADVRQMAQRHHEKNNDEENQTNPLTLRLQEFEEIKRRRSRTNSASEWIKSFQEQLSILGWPGERTLDSVEYQQANQWYLLLEKLASIDSISGSTLGFTFDSNAEKKQPKKSFTFSRIFSELSGLAATTHFQPEVKGTPINILGTLEGAGLKFTHCWLMGMNNKDWPPKPNPNPLLPIQLQRKYQLPRASIERENRYAESITQQLLQSAETIIVSYVTQFDESESLPSALIEDLPIIELSDLFTDEKNEQENQSQLKKFYKTLEASQIIEIINCEQGPPLISNPGEPTKGGSDILKQQALCPFNAFAKHRLNVYQPDEPTLALTALDKGNIIHNALELFWSATHSQDELKKLSADEIRENITQILGDVFNHHYKRDMKHLGEFYYSLEQSRFIEMLTAWLEQEKERPSFSVVATEESMNSDFSGMTFKLRIDRIDKNSAGELLLIDYKTGKVSNAKLSGNRPEEPQLPLYLLCYPETVSAIAFAQIRSHDFKIVGIGELSDQQGYKDIKTSDKAKISQDWSAAREHFKTELEKLAQEYQQGFCSVDFKKDSDSSNSFLQYLTPLNRSPESSFIDYFVGQPNTTKENTQKEVRR